MDPVTIVSGVLGVLVPFVKKGAEEFASIAGQAVYDKAKKLFDAIKARWSGDKEATDNLERFSKRPERYEAAVGDILKEKVTEDAEFATELERLLDDLGPHLYIIQRMKKGEHVTGLDADQVSEGTVDVEQDIEDGKDITGAKIKRIGR